MKFSKVLLVVVITTMTSLSLFAVEENALPSIGGYDPVSYFTQNKAMRGSGMHASTHKGQTFLFASKKNKEMFDKNPSKYMPEFGGYCAFGAALGKKFHSDPTVFEVVNNKLYLNLNKNIQTKWNADKSKMIKDGHAKWKTIRSKSARSL